MELVTKWHDIRADFEDKFYEIAKDDKISVGRAGTHKVDYFHGHCNGEGGKNYRIIQASHESFQKVANLY